METKFFISTMLNLKKEKLTYGKFSLGTDKASSTEIFDLLKGKSESPGICTVQMQFIQHIGGLPVPIGMKYCTLEELKENVALISREIFRIAQLESGNIVSLE